MGTGSSPPLGPKPKSALPSYLINGSSPLNNSNTRDSRERESLNSSIRSSFHPRTPAEFESSSTESMSHSNSASNANAGATTRSLEPARYVPSDL